MERSQSSGSGGNRSKVRTHSRHNKLREEFVLRGKKENLEYPEKTGDGSVDQ